jgi:hypothetical protein
LRKTFFFSLVSIFTENPGFTLNANNLSNRLICSRWVCLSVAVLFFFSGRCVKADPIGDFFTKVGRSISKAFEPQHEPNHPSKKTTKRAGRRTTSPQSNVAGASPTPIEQPTVVAQEKVNPTVTLMRASAAPPEKAKGDLPYGIPVSGQKGIVTSPYLPEGGYIDVRAFAPGSAVRDPYTRKIFLVP